MKKLVIPQESGKASSHITVLLPKPPFAWKMAVDFVCIGVLTTWVGV